MKADRYTVVAIALHWAIALMILANIPLGWWMHEAVEEHETAARAVIAYQAHKSIGLTVLLLSLVRLGWRFAHPPPPLPDAMAAWEKLVARVTHWAFYALMIALPLSGWIYVSTGWSHETDAPLSVPTLWFGLFRVPHLFGLDHAADAVRAGVSDSAITAHETLAWAMLALAALHVGAALKHWVIDRDLVAPQMLPGLPSLGQAKPAPDGRARLIGLGASAAAIALFAIGAGAYLTQPIARAPAAAVEGEAEEHGGHRGEDAHDDHGGDAREHAAAQPPQAAPAATAAPPAWIIDRAASSIRFTGTHAGAPFEGRFNRWRADIRFDPDNLDASRAVVTIETGSAADGNPLHDQSLPAAEWLDSAGHPTATFRTTRIRHRSGDSYEARGVLNLKGRDLAIDLPFTLRIQGDRAVMTGAASIDRREADLGMTSDSDFEWVSREIGVAVRVEATRTP